MSDHAAPILEAVLRDAGRRVDDHLDLSAPGRGRRPQPARHGAGQLPHHGDVPDGRRPGDQRGRPDRRIWDVENLLVADSSVFATSAGYNPTLTIVALAARAAHLLAGTPLPATVAHR